MTNLYSGEIAIVVGEREYLFRPSFRAIASLGTPRELVKMLMAVQSQKDPFKAVMTAIDALHACYVGDDGADWRLTGFYKEFKGHLRWVLGTVPTQNLHVIGARLLINGIVGKPKPRKGDKGGDATRFDPSEYVAMAQAHLGMNSSDAWDMTMIEFQRAMDAKFPPDDKTKDQPTAEEAQALIDHVADIRRRAKLH